MIVVTGARARRGKMGVHGQPPEFHEERHVLSRGRAPRKLHASDKVRG
jgi:hypothetical protein